MSLTPFRARRAWARCAFLLLATSLAACGDDSPGDATPPADSTDAVPGDVTPLAEGPADDAAAEDSEADAPPADSPRVEEVLPRPFRELWEPWLGDLDGMIERRVIRAVTPYGGYQLYYDDGQPRGAVYELVQRLETHFNEQLGRRHIKVYVVVIPLSRDQLIPALLNGNADMIAADLTATQLRSEQAAFSRPLLKDIDEIVVTGPSAPALGTVYDLAGQSIHVRRSSSYYEHLERLGDSFALEGLPPPNIIEIDELLEAEDILEMTNAGMITMTVMDDYKAGFWSHVFPNIVLRDDLVIHEGGSIAWLTRKDAPGLMTMLNGFLREYGRGTLIGNDTYNRYLEDADDVRCADTVRSAEEIRNLAALFQRYGDEYNFDWLQLAAQGYQESGLRQDRTSHAGAVGIMQLKPSTAADRNVGIPDISTIENNIHAGARYMRFLADRYFNDDGIDDLNQWLLSLAAYNAGPARVARLRREARENGYDPNLWFNNVEIIAAKRIGRETVTYVSSIFKYYAGYQMAWAKRDARKERHADTLTACGSG